MNVAHFASDFYPNLGGVQEFVRQLGSEQKRKGGAPVIFSNRWPKSLASREVYEGLPVHRTVFRVPERNWRQWIGAVLLGPPALMRIVALLRAARVDVIHIQCVSSNAFYALQASRILGLPLVVTLHGELSVDDSRLFERSAFARKLLRVILSKADAVTACSGHALREAEEFYGESLEARSQVIHNGVRNEEFLTAIPYAHPRPYIFSIGRHVRQKGFDFLLRAYEQVIRSGLADHDLLIAGDGPEREALQRMARNLGVEERVHFIGRTDRPTTARLFAGCSFFVLSSRLEPLGIVNLEAMASAKAVLASDVGGVPEIVIHEQNGLLVEPGNIQALAQGMARLLAERDLRARLGAAGRELARCFDWSDVAEKYAQIYQSLRPVRRETLSTKTHA